MTTILESLVQNSTSTLLDMTGNQPQVSLSDMVGGEYTGEVKNLVTYRLNSTDLQDYFEVLEAEQIHIALEGALNIIFGRPSNSISSAISELVGDGLANLGVEDEDTEDELTHEAQIVSDVAFAITAREIGADVLQMDGVDPMDHEKYPFFESLFNSIVTKLSADFAADKYNQDVVTLTGEMDFFTRIELYTYQYDTNNNILTFTIETM